MDKLLPVAQITGRGDPAFNRKADGFRVALVRYAKTRSPKDLAAIPLLEGKKPRLYAVRVLTPEARAVVIDTPGMAARALTAVRVGVAEIRHPDGTVEKAPVELRGGDLGSMATQEWTKTIAGHGGAALLDELGAVVMTRADFGDFDEAEGGDPLDLYALPSGARLAL